MQVVFSSKLYTAPFDTLIYWSLPLLFNKLLITLGRSGSHSLLWLLCT
jgi:hypothetical protein